MTKFISILLLFLCISFGSKSQNLNGEWEGEFVDGNVNVPIYLEFLLNPDSTYSVYSYSKALSQKGNDTIAVCLVIYKILSSDSIYLEETEVIDAPKYFSICLQKMFLKINKSKNEITLAGQWNTETINCISSGSIFFRRIKPNRIKQKRRKTV